MLPPPPRRTVHPSPANVILLLFVVCGGLAACGDEAGGDKPANADAGPNDAAGVDTFGGEDSENDAETPGDSYVAAEVRVRVDSGAAQDGAQAEDSAAHDVVAPADTNSGDGVAGDSSGADVAADTAAASLPVCVPCNGHGACVNAATGTTCAVPGGAASTTILHNGPTGGFCTKACASNAACSTGYACEADTQGIKRCFPVGGLCACPPNLVAKAAKTSCAGAALNNPFDASFSACKGTRTCTAKGLSACSAPLATIEVCDAVDNDCDGSTDEGDMHGQGAKPKYVPLCNSGSYTVIDDFCRANVCAGKAGCKLKNIGTTCDDANPCTSDTVCTLAGPATSVVELLGACLGGKKLNCDDGDACTTDYCLSATKCGHKPVPACGPCKTDLDCNDSKICTIDTCVVAHGTATAAAKKTCQHKPSSCDDKDPCTLDACDLATGNCVHSQAPVTTKCGTTLVCDETKKCAKPGDCDVFDLHFDEKAPKGVFETPSVSNSNTAIAVAAAADGGGFFVGTADNNGAVVRRTAKGGVVWASLYSYGKVGGSIADAFSGIAPRTDGTYWLYGATHGTAAKAATGGVDPWLVRIDSKGKVVFKAAVAGPLRDSYDGGATIANNGLAVAGFRAHKVNVNHVINKAHVAWFDAAGKKLADWQTPDVKSTGASAVASLAKTGSICVAGRLKNEATLWLFDNAYKLKATRMHGGNVISAFATVMVLADGRFAAAGWRRPAGIWQRSRALMVIAQASLKSVDTFTYTGPGPIGLPSGSGSTYFSDLATTEAGRIIAVGRAFSPDKPGLGKSGVGSMDGWAVRLGLHGQQVGPATFFGGTTDDNISSIARTKGGYLLAGSRLELGKNKHRRGWNLRVTPLLERICPGDKKLCKDSGYCEDGNICTIDACDTFNGTCSHTAKKGCCTADWQCNDGKPCTVDSCNTYNGYCKTEPVKGCCDGPDQCDDSNPCTTDLCEAKKKACGHTAIKGCCHINASCNDGVKCTIDTCVNNKCAHSQGCCTKPSDCKTGDPCIAATCDVKTGACGVKKGPKCDDGNACTLDICAKNGGCSSTPVAKGGFCPTGACDGKGACTKAPCAVYTKTYSLLDEFPKDGIPGDARSLGVVAVNGGGALHVDLAVSKKNANTIRVVRRDGKGTVLSVKRYGDPKVSKYPYGPYQVMAAVGRKDGGLWVVGQNTAFVWDPKKTDLKSEGTAWLIDSKGKLAAWFQTGLKNMDYLWAATGVGDNGVVATGMAVHPKTSGFVPLLVHLDANGKLVGDGIVVYEKTKTTPRLGMGIAYDPASKATLTVGALSKDGLIGRLDLRSGKTVLAQRTIASIEATSAADVAFIGKGRFAVAGSKLGAWIGLIDSKLKLYASHDIGPAGGSLMAVDHRAGRIAAVGHHEHASGMEGIGVFLDAMGTSPAVVRAYGGGGRHRLYTVSVAANGTVYMGGESRPYSDWTEYSVPSDDSAWHLAVTATGAQVCPGQKVTCADHGMCDDGKPCTEDLCMTATGACKHGPKTGCCGATKDCDDANPCTQDSCVHSGCEHKLAPAGTSCVMGKTCGTFGGCGCARQDIVTEVALGVKGNKPTLQATAMAVGGKGATYAVGYAPGKPGQGWDGFIAKHDKVGKLAWRKAYHVASTDALFGAVAAPKGGVWSVGRRYVGASGKLESGWVLRVDDAGGVVAQGSFGAGAEQFRGAAVGSNGGVIAVGRSGKWPKVNLYVVQVDAKAKLVGAKDKIVAVADARCYGYGAARDAKTGRIVAVGRCEHLAKPGAQGVIAVLSKTGATVAVKRFGKAGRDGLHAATFTDNKLVAVGYSRSHNGIDDDAWIVIAKSDLSQVTHHYRIASRTDRLLGITPTANGVAIVGMTASNVQKRPSGWLTEVGLDGKTLWSRTYTRPTSSVLHSVFATANGFVLGGASSRSGGDQTPYAPEATWRESRHWLMRVDKAGKVTCL